MHADLVLVCHASTAAVRRAAFPADDPLDDHGAPEAAAAASTFIPSGRVFCAPSLAARQTAAALGLDPTVDEAIRDCDFGQWAGRAVADVAPRDEPDAFSGWLTDPHSAPHGGEPLADLLLRVGSWVEERRRGGSSSTAITHPAVIRAAIVQAIEGSTATFWHIDIGPLSRTGLRSDGTRWALRGLAQ